jgi:hypothetical protein
VLGVVLVMADSAKTFRDRAATYQSMETYVTEEPALKILRDLAADNIARAEELEALAKTPQFASQAKSRH